MPEPSDYDRYHHILGLAPGASLVEIEEAWRLRLADSHPDRFADSAKEWATARAQDINNARDELRGYWRAHGEPPPSLIADQARARAIHLADAETPDAAAPPPPEPDGAPRRSRRPGPERDEEPPVHGPAFRYAAAAALAFSALLGAVALLSPESDPGAGHKTTAAAIEALGQNRADLPLWPSMPALEAEHATATEEIRTPEPEPEQVDAAAAPPQEALPPGLPFPELQPAEETSAAAVESEPDRPAEGNPALADAPAATAAPAAPAPSAPQPRDAASRARPDPARVRPAPPAASGTPPPSAAPLAPPYPHGAAGPAAYGRAGDPAVMAAMSACHGDLRTYCAHAQFGGGRVAQCLRDNFRHLSQGCSSALQAMRAARQGGSAPPIAR